MICFPLDDTPYEAKDMGAYLCTRTRGVYSADGNLAVAPSSSGLAVTVSPGLAWLRWSDYWGVAALQETALTLTLDAADGSLSRMDAVVCRLNKVDNQVEIVIKKGSWSSSPTVVAPVRDSNYDEIYLATVLVGPGAVSVSVSDITDQRLNEAYCGIMRDGVTGIPTEQLQAQTQAIIDDLRKVIAGIEQGSEVMLKAVYDAHNVGKDIFSAIPAPNLADNTNFRDPVNQRGFSSIEEPTGNVYPYTIDRWYFNDRFGSAALIDEGVKVGASGSGLGLMQKIETDADETYTLSAKINGAVESVTGNPSTGNISSDNGHLFLGPVDGNPAQVLIGLASGAVGTTITVEWVKLEKGTFPTVWQPKGYAQELLECLRYYYRLGGGWQTLCKIAGWGSVVPIETPVGMRASPSLVVGGENGLRIFAPSGWVGATYNYITGFAPGRPRINIVLSPTQNIDDYNGNVLICEGIEALSADL